MTNTIKNDPMFLHSEQAERGAQQLIKNIKNGELQKAILPNTSPDYSGMLEHENYVSFGAFLNSSNGKILAKRLEEAEH